MRSIRFSSFVLAFLSLVLLVFLLPAPPESSGREEQIIGGSVVRDSRFGFTVAIVRRPKSPARGAFCGGSLIRSRWVLTAAHCVGLRRPSQLQVAGGRDLRKPAWTRGVELILTHPNWDFDYTGLGSDAALLRLSGPVRTRTIGLIPEQTQGGLDDPGRAANISGWGVAGPVLASLSLMRQAEVRVLHPDRCVKAYGQRQGGFNPDLMICAGLKRGGVDACEGDSGGPLTSPNNPAKIIGIIAWGRGCASPLYPGVYTKAAAIAPWARDVVENYVPPGAGQAGGPQTVSSSG